MKRKYILAAAALAVLCAGVAAYSMNQNTELPSSTPNSSSTVSSIASSEPESGSTSVTDNRDIAKAENFVTYQVSKGETATGTETHPEDQVNVSQDKADAEYDRMTEDLMQQYMKETGATREEAEAWINEGSEKNEEAKQKREEIAAQREKEEQAFDAAMDQWYLEHTGMAADQFGALSIQEKTEWIRQHPDVDFSTSPERTWDWQN